MNGLHPSLKACPGSIMESDILRQEEEDEEEGKEEDQKVERELPGTALEEEPWILGYCSHSPESMAWSLSALEQALYLSLPGWAQAALLCNLMPKIGLVGFRDTFPARLISYLLLPYTLPPCIFFEFTYRLLLRLRHIPENVFWLWQGVKQIVLFITKVTVSSLKKYLADRFLPSFHLTPTLEIQSECEVPTNTAQMRRRSTLRIQLSSVASSSSSTDSQSLSHPEPEALAFTFQLDLGLEVDSQPDAQALPPCQQPLPLGFLPSSEGEEETTPNLTTCQVPAGAGSE